MKKIILLSLLVLTTVFSSTINLTGEYSNQLGNPFRKLLNEGNTKTINIYSSNKNVVLSVTSNLDNSNNYGQLQHPKEFILNNKSVENVVEDFYIEEFEVFHKEGGLIVNILSGSINLDYVDIDNNQQLNHLNKVEITLNLEIVRNGEKVLKVIKMDNTLGRTGDTFDFTIRTTFDFEIKNLDRIVREIIENSIYNNLLKGNK